MRFVSVVLFSECVFIDSSDNEYRYSEGGLHRPLFKSGNVELSGDHIIGEYSNVTPRKGCEFSEMELPLDLSECMGIVTNSKSPVFIMIRLEQDIFSSMVYGWVDSWEPIATKGPSANTRIRWHLDYWITLSSYRRLAPENPDMISQVSLRSGRIKRGPAALARPDPSAPRYWKHNSNNYIELVRYYNLQYPYDNLPANVTMTKEARGPFCYVAYTETDSQTGWTTFRLASWGVNEPIEGIDNVPYHAMSVGEVYQGYLEEFMGIDPNSILSVFFAPIAISDLRYAKKYNKINEHMGVFWHDIALSSIPWQYDITIQTEGVPDDYFITTDQRKFMVMDPLGNVYGTIPWGLKFTKMLMTLNIGTNIATLDIEFRNGDEEGLGEGRKIQIPLINVPITTNAKASYTYSGQQEYDRQTARIQQQTAAASGVAGLGGSAIGGAVSGAVATANPAGAAIGAAAGLLGGAAGVAANFWITEWADSKTREATDRLLSNQTANALIDAGGTDWYYVYGGKWKLIWMERDPVSKGELETEQSELGYVTDTYTTDVDTAIANGGPWRVEGLEVVGDLPPQGKQYIAALFARGVHLDLIQ